MREAPEDHYGRAVDMGASPEVRLRALVSETDAVSVVDLADEPVLGAAAKLRLASLALHLGLSFEGPGVRLTPPRYEPVDFDGPKLAVIGTGKRTGKTAVAGHWAALLREAGADPVIVSMGRGGPPEPQVAGADTSLEDLERFVADGRHGASDYLEDAVLAGVRAVGCRRVGGGLAGEPFESNVVEGAAVAASLEPGTLIFEGSGACLPPLVADRTVCVVGERSEALGELGPYRLLRADLAVVTHGDEDLAGEVAEVCPGRVLRCAMRPEPAEELPADARVAVFSTGAGVCDGLEPVVASQNLARRSALERDLEKAARDGCDVYLTELKAAAIDTVAKHARAAGARVGFIRNRPVGVDEDLDAALMDIYEEARAGG